MKKQVDAGLTNSRWRYSPLNSLANAPNLPTRKVLEWRDGSDSSHDNPGRNL